ncbi:MAG: DUF1311 domain-containing protein [Verrucomicrobia bacterium]|nr:DUF1311 domain-containing protein [Verrucomicrobiota bacterium]
MKTTILVCVLSAVSISSGGDGKQQGQAIVEDYRAAIAFEYTKVDEELNKAYQLLLKRLEPREEKALRKAQRAWIAFRDAEADFLVSEMKGGTGQGPAHTASLTELNKERIKVLKKHLQERSQ